MFAGIQASSYGFSGIQRPTYDYVRAGDVIRIALALDAVFTTPPISAFRAALGSNTHVRLISLDQSQLGSAVTLYAGQLIVTVQALNDFNRLDDVTRYVAGLAQGAGLSVLINTTRGEFISQVEDTGGQVKPTIPAQQPTSAGGGVAGAVESFAEGLFQSPVTLAVIIGGAVLLLAAMKK